MAAKKKGGKPLYLTPDMERRVTVIYLPIGRELWYRVKRKFSSNADLFDETIRRLVQEFTGLPSEEIEPVKFGKYPYPLPIGEGRRYVEVAVRLNPELSGKLSEKCSGELDLVYETMANLIEQHLFRRTSKRSS